VAATPAPQRLVHALGESPLAERVARAQEVLYGPLLRWAQRIPLHSGVLGHSLHPALTDVTTGAWLGASVLDLAGGPSSRRGATLLAGVGVVAAVPTALAGAGDWAGMTGEVRRIGAVHALGTDVAIVLLAGSVAARLRGAHGLGAGLALAGNAVVAGAGFLGGHLALARGTARRTPTTR
jgi:hypothetical protein